MKDKLIKSGEGKTSLSPSEYYPTLIKRIQDISLSHLSDEYLRKLSQVLKYNLNHGRSENEILVEAFALVMEVSKRVLKLCPYDTQIMAGLALFEGRIAQMQTGEGKTLAGVMPAYLLGLSGKGVHILTFNDYLARRDAAWMGPIYTFLGLTVGTIQEGMSHNERQRAYQCDITYLTAREAGFDYLRDFLVMRKGDVLLRPYHVAIVDEADSIMIDEARIPLVIAGKQKMDESIILRIHTLV